MNIKAIKTERDYETALVRVDGLMDAEMDTPEGDELDVLVTLVEAYESKHYPLAFPKSCLTAAGEARLCRCH